MRYVALVLAAGLATRFGGDKLSAPLGGEPLLFHAIRAARAAPVDRVIVITRPGVETGEWPGSPRVETLALESRSLSETLRAGIAAEASADGAFVFLGDMPRIPPELAGQLAGTIGSAYAALPCRHGTPGHPVLLSRAAFPAIARLAGDEGAGRLLRGRDDVVRVEWDSPAIHFDVDRPSDLARA